MAGQAERQFAQVVGALAVEDEIRPESFEAVAELHAADVLVAMNPAALKANAGDVPPGGAIVVNEDAFTAQNLKKAAYEESPLEDGSLNDFTVFEKADRVGGTWRENTYPGVGCDVPSHLYSYSFEPNPEWTEFFAQHHELQAYFERCMDEYGVRDHVRFETEVLGAEYDERAGAWSVRVRGPDGAEQVLGARAVISAVGGMAAWNLLQGPPASTDQTLITLPAVQTHGDLPAAVRERLGICSSLLRLSVGLEEPEDIVNDLERGLAARN